MDLSSLLPIDRIYDMWESYRSIIILILSIIGIIKLLTLLQQFCQFTWKYYLRPKHNLLRRYGKCWAIITGGSEDIGEAIAHELASQGLNILLVSRSKYKLKKARERIILRYKVECEYLVFDFNRPEFDEDALRPFITLFQEKDVGVLINNVGTSEIFKFEESNYSIIEQIMNVNMISKTYLTHIALPYLLRRPTKSLIVFISSVAADVKPPFYTMYASSKSYIRTFGEALGREMRERIEISIISPGGVMTRMHNNKFPIWDIGVENVGEHYAAHFGRDLLSYGHPYHLFQKILFKIVPKGILYNVIRRRLN